MLATTLRQLGRRLLCSAIDRLRRASIAFRSTSTGTSSLGRGIGIARPHVELGGFWYPQIRGSGYDSWVERVAALDATSGATWATWAPDGPPAMDYIEISPDGWHLSTVTFREDRPRLALFDIDSERERVLPVAVNPGFGGRTRPTPRSISRCVGDYCSSVRWRWP